MKKPKPEYVEVGPSFLQPRLLVVWSLKAWRGMDAPAKKPASVRAVGKLRRRA